MFRNQCTCCAGGNNIHRKVKSFRTGLDFFYFKRMLLSHTSHNIVFAQEKMEHQSSLGSHRRIPARETKEPSAADGAKKSLAEIGKCTNSGTGGMTRSGVRRKGGRSAKSPRAAPLTAQRRSEASAAAAAASILALRRGGGGGGGGGLKRVHKGCISLSLRWRQSFGIEVTKREGGRGGKEKDSPT